MTTPFSFSAPFALTSHASSGIDGAFSLGGTPNDNLSFGQAEVQCTANIAIGNLALKDKTIHFPDIGGDIEFAYFYNNQGNPNWRLTFGRSLNKVGNDFVITEADGRNITYHYNEKDNCYYADQYSVGRPYFKIVGKEFIWCDPATREQNIFSEEGFLLASINATGNKTSYDYKDGKLICIKTASGKNYLLNRSENTGVEKLEIYLEVLGGQNKLFHTYLIQDNQLRLSMTADGYKTHYYYANGQLESVNQTDKTNLAFTYQDKKLLTIKAGNYPKWSFKYSDKTTIVTQGNEEHIISFDEAKHLTTHVHNWEQHKYEINKPGQVERITYPDGSTEIFTYDVNSGLLLKHKQRDGTSITYQYDANHLLQHKTLYDHKSIAHTTHYLYQQTKHGGWVPHYEISPAGRVTQFVADPITGLISQEKTYAKDFYPLEKGFSTSALEEWTGLKTADRINITDYSHHSEGLIASKKGYRNKTEGNYQEEVYEYDDLGNPTLHRQKIQPSFYLKQQARYDLLSRPLYNAKGIENNVIQDKIIDYQDNKISTHYKDKSLGTALLDERSNLKELKLTSNAVTRTEKNEYLEKNIKIHIDADGKQSYQFFDDADRLIATISPSGAVVLFEHDAVHRMVTKKAYDKPIDPKLLNEGPSYLQRLMWYKNKGISFDKLKSLLVGKDSTEDRITKTVTGLNGKPQYEIDADGYLTEYRYDGFSNLQHHIQYKAKITSSELKLLETGKSLSRIPNRTVDIVNSYFHDLDGLLIGKQDPAGYVEQYILDAAGHTSEAIHYSKPTLTFTDSFPTVEKQPLTDAHIHYFRNQLGEISCEVDAEGYITTRSYFDDGKPKSVRRYENKVPSNWDPNKPPIPVAADNDLELTYEYDALRRIQFVKSSNGAVTEYAYDDRERLVGEVTKDSQSKSIDGDHLRGERSLFNAFGDLTAKANPFVTQRLAKEHKSLQDLLEITEQNIHSSGGLKVKSTDPLGHATYYFYDDDKNPVMAIDGRGAIIEFTNNTHKECMQERHYYTPLPLAELKNIHGGYLAEAFRKRIQLLRSEKDQITAYKRNKRGLIEEKTDAESNISKFEYDAFKRCVVERLPVNDKNPSLVIQHTFEQRGHEVETLKIADGQTIKTSASFDHYLGKQTEQIDAKGAHTKFKLDLLGRLKSIDKEINKDEYLTIEAQELDAFDRPTMTVNADGEKLKYTYNQKERSTTIINSARPNQKTIIKKNIFDEPILIQDLEKDRVLCQESFTHAPDGQIASHTNGADETESTAFDLKGQVSEITSSNKTKTIFKRDDAAGHLTSKEIETPNGIKLKTSFEPNIFGENETVTNPRGFKQKNEFNKKSELVKVTHATETGKPARTDLYTRNAQGEMTDEIKGDEKTPNQYHKQWIHDGFNRVTVEVVDPEALKITKRQAFDNCDHIVVFTNPKGYLTRQLFNLQGQKKFEITDLNVKECSITEFDYTPGGKISGVRVYATPVAKQKLSVKPDLEAVKKLVVASNQDVITRFFYDDLGNERFKLTLIFSHEKNSYEAIVEEKNFDGKHRPIKEARYAHVIDVADIQKLTTKIVAERVAGIKDPAQDRILYHWYDKASQPCLTINQNGFVQDKLYRHGHVIKYTERFNSLENPEKYLEENLESVRAKIAPHEKDRTTHFVRDDLGRVVFEVLPNGKVTRNKYDENSNNVEICEFKNRFKPSTNYEVMVKALYQLESDPKKDTITKKQYNVNDEEETITDALDNKDTFVRNSLGHVTDHYDRARNRWQFKIDRALRQTHEISPEVTATHVIKQNGKLIYHDFKTTITKETEFDTDNNATKISIGQIDEKRALATNPALKGNLPQPRVFNANYQNHKKLISTQVEALIDDNSSYSKYWEKLEKLPEKKVKLKSGIIRNVQGKKLAKQNENGKWSFWIRDNLGRVIYEIQNETAVIKYKNNVFGEVEEERRLAMPVNIAVAKYINQGITLDDITFDGANKDKVVLQESDEDRLTKFTHNQSGKVVHIQSGPVYYFANGKFGKANPETKYAYNIFGDQIYAAKLISPGVWAEKFTWVDESGDPIAEVDEDNFVKVYQRNVFGKEIERIEFANPIKTDPSKLDSVKDLLAQIVKSPKDRKIITEYDALRQKITETILVRSGTTDKFINPISHKLINVNGKTISKAVSELIKRSWGYSATQKLMSETDEQNGTTFKYHDARGEFIGEAGVQRSQAKTDKKIIPLTIYKPTIYGQIAVTQKSAKGCLTADASKMPVFLDNQSIAETITLHDSRGLKSIVQDPRGNSVVTTHQPDKELARTLRLYPTWAYKKDMYIDKASTDKPNLDKKIIHIDEDRYSCDNFNHVTTHKKVRDGALKGIFQNQVNIFGEIEGEKHDEKDYPLYRKRDTQGRIWSTNADNGGKFLNLYDLRGLPTLRLQSGVEDLSKLNYLQLPNLFQKDIYLNDVYEKTEHAYSARGGLIATNAPFHKSTDALPTHKFAHDHWGNTISSIDSLGNETNSDFNYRNLEIKRTQPEVLIMGHDYKESVIRPITEFRYNVLGGNIVVIDANGHAKTFMRDEANQLVSTILGDGTKTETRLLNALGKTTDLYDARELHWQYQRDKSGNVNVVTPPSSLPLGITYDALNNPDSVTNLSAKASWFFNHDINQNIVEQYLPEGQLTTKTFDLNHQPLSIKAPNGLHVDGTSILSAMSWKRNYFGLPESFIDLLSKTHKTTYDEAARKKTETSTGGTSYSTMLMDYASHKVDEFNIRNPRTNKKTTDPQNKYPLFSNSAFPLPVQQQGISYEYKQGLLTSIQDSGVAKTTNYKNDSEGRITEFEITNHKGDIIFNAKTTFDGLERPISVENTHRLATSFNAKTAANLKYDAVGNRMMTGLRMDIPGYCEDCHFPLQAQKFYNSYDDADRIKMHNAISSNGKFMLDPYGIEYGYEKNLRKQAKRKGLLIKMEYDDEDRFKGSTAPHLDIIQSYDTSGVLNNYNEGKKGAGAFTRTRKLSDINKNGWHKKEKLLEDNNLKSETDLEYRPDGLTFKTHRTLHQDNNRKTIQDDLVNEYVGTDHWQLSTANGIRTSSVGKSEKKTAQFFYDANFHLGGKTFSDDEMVRPDLNWPPIYFERTPDGKMLSKNYITGVQGLNANAVHSSHFVSDTEGHVFGGFSQHTNLLQQAHHAAAHLNGQPKNAPIIEPIRPYPQIKPVGKFELLKEEKKRTPVDWFEPENPYNGFPYYSVPEDTSLQELATRLYGEVEAADEIAKLNGLIDGPFFLKAGMILHLPQYLQFHNKAENHRPYDEFIRLMVGALNPHLPTPIKKDDGPGFIAILAKMIALAIVIYGAGVLAGSLLGPGGALAALGIEGTTAQAALTGVFSALGDAGVQGLAVLGNIQKDFSWNEVLETGVAAGVGVGLTSPDVTIVNQALVVAAAAATTQIIEIKLGLRHKFDAGALLVQVAGNLGAKYLNKGVSHLTKGMPERVAKAGQYAVNSTANALLGHGVMGTPLNIQNIAANALGSAVGNEIAESVASHLPTPPESSSNKDTDLPIEQASTMLSEMNRAKMNGDSTAVSESRDYLSENYMENPINRKLMQDAIFGSPPSPTPNPLPSPQNEIKDTTAGILTFAKDMTKGTLSGLALSAVQDVRNDLRSVAYGNSDQKIDALRSLAEDTLIIATADVGAGLIGSAFKGASKYLPRWSIFGGEGVANGFKLLGKYDAYSPGKLSNRNVSTFMGQKYSTFKLEKDTIMYRGGSESSSLGEFFTLEKPTSELQVRIDKAVLPKWPGGGSSIINTGYEVLIPKGTIVHMGEVAPKGNIFMGGTQQILIEKPWLNPAVKVLNKFSLREELLWNNLARK